MQKELYEIAHETGLWIVLCNYIKVSGKIIQIWFLVLWAPQVECHPAPLHWREDRHPSIQTSATHSKTTGAHTPTFATLSSIPSVSSSTSKTSSLTNRCVECWNVSCLHNGWTFVGEQKYPWVEGTGCRWSWQFTGGTWKRDARREVKQGSLKKTASKVGC